MPRLVGGGAARGHRLGRGLNQVNDVENAELIFLIGANPTSNHPVAATWMKNAARRGAKLVYADPRRSRNSRHAWRMLQFKPDTDVAMLNAMIHTIIEEGLVDEKFVADRTSGYEALKGAKNFSPEKMAPVCGIPAETLREVARAFAAKASMIPWGMGISQHVHGTDNARCLIALCLMTGQVGKPGSGLHPLRGQNNVQGASDSGLIPMMYPDYQRVNNDEANQRFEKFWGMPLDKKPGLTVVEIVNAAYDGKIRGMYIMGENPAMSDPDVEHARAGMAKLEHLVVQDIFLTETAYLADVVLPATAWPEKTGTVTNTDRMVQLGRKAVEPPGEAREDFWILVNSADAWGWIGNMNPQAGVRRDARLHGLDPRHHLGAPERDSSVTYPCENEERPGPAGGVHHALPHAHRAREVRARRPDPRRRAPGQRLSDGAHHRPAARALAYRRDDAPRGVLDADRQPERVASPGRSAELQAKPGDVVTVASRRGRISLYARADAGTPRGAVFIPFAFYEAAANLLTNPVLDPFGKIPSSSTAR